MMMSFFSRFRDVCMSIVVSVPSPLVLKHFFVIMSQIVLPSGWLTLCHVRYVVSQPLVDKSLLLEGIDIHIMNWRKLRLFLKGFCLSAPVSFNALHMPLIDHSYNIFMFFQLKEVTEDSNISLINQYLFLFGSYLAEKTYKEVNTTSIHWLGKGFTSSHFKGVQEIVILGIPWAGQFSGV